MMIFYPWDASRIYQTGDEVERAGNAWTSKEDNNLGHDPLTSPKYWRPAGD
jgi:hypothetical protein